MEKERISLKRKDLSTRRSHTDKMIRRDGKTTHEKRRRKKESTENPDGMEEQFREGIPRSPEDSFLGT